MDHGVGPSQAASVTRWDFIGEQNNKNACLFLAVLRKWFPIALLQNVFQLLYLNILGETPAKILI